MAEPTVAEIVTLITLVLPAMILNCIVYQPQCNTVLLAYAGWLQAKETVDDWTASIKHSFSINWDCSDSRWHVAPVLPVDFTWLCCTTIETHSAARPSLLRAWWCGVHCQMISATYCTFSVTSGDR